MDRQEAKKALIELIEGGWLNGVHLFGNTCDESMTDVCCLHKEEAGYGIMDNFVQRRNQAERKYGFAGSDCNRAEDFIMRPSDILMTQEIRELLADDVN